MREKMTVDEITVIREVKCGGGGGAAGAFSATWRMGAVVVAACLAITPAWTEDEVDLMPGEAVEESDVEFLSEGAPGAGELTSYIITSPSLDPTESGAKKAVYFNKKVYTVSRYSDSNWCKGCKGDYIGCMSYGTDSSGRLSEPERMKWVAYSSETGDGGLSGQDVTACVYSGRIYVVYDYINPNNWSERLLYVKSSNNPKELGWEPKGGARIEAAAAVNTGFGIGAPQLNVAAAVLGGKLYVFYTHIRLNGLRSVVFDGKSWSAGPSLEGSGFSALDAQTVIANDGNELIAIAGCDNTHCRVMGFDGQTIRLSVNSISLYAKGLSRGYVRLAGGSVQSPGAQANLLQIFVHGGEYVCRFEYSLPNVRGDSGQFSEGSLARIKFFNGWGWCPATHFLNKDGDSKDLQQYITLVGPAKKVAGESLKLYAATYTSDCFKHLQTNQINTALGSLPSAWSIIGVIEGVPPFSLNGTQTGSTSIVTYGQSAQKEVSTSQAFEASFSIGIGGKDTLVPSFSLEFTQGFKNVYDWSKTITRSYTFTMENKGKNIEGLTGYLIVSKPNLTVSNYERRASDQTTPMGNVNFTYVTDVSIEPVPYLLENPEQAGFKGIKAKPKSSDYSKWLYMPIPVNLTLDGVSLLQLTADINGTISTKSKVEITTKNKTSRKSSSKVKVEGNFLKLFKTSSEFTFSLDSVNSTAFSENISASLSLPEGDSKLERIVVKPYWLVPDENSTTKPFWVPDDYLWNKPWCLTWSVTSLNPSPKPSKAITEDFNKDGRQDVAAFKTPTARSPAAVGKGAKSAGTVGILYNITRGAKKRTAEKITLQSSSASMKLLCAGDLEANGCSDLLWLDTQRNALVATLVQEDGTTVFKELQGIAVDDNIRPVEMGHFLADSDQPGILTRDALTGDLQLHQLDPATLDVVSSYNVYSPGYSHWIYLGRGDFDGDNNWDLLVKDDETGEYNIIFLQPDEEAGVVGRIATVQDELVIGDSIRMLADLTYTGVCDFNGDGRSDMLFVENGRKLIAALMDAEYVLKAGYVKGATLKADQTIITLGDTNQDGRADIIVEQDSGDKRKLFIWSLGEMKKSFRKSTDALAVTATESLTLDQEFQEDQSIQLFPSLD